MDIVNRLQSVEFDMRNSEESQEEEFDLKFRHREAEMVSIDRSRDTLKSLKKVAASRDMSCKALLTFYIGQGLRNDLARLSGDRVLETTKKVLAKHIQSEEEVSSIIREIQSEATG